MNRGYWGTRRRGNWMVTSIQIVSDTALAALQRPELHVRLADVDADDDNDKLIQLR